MRALHCVNINSYIKVEDKCLNLSCVHNDQGVNSGCLQIMFGRYSLPIDIQHHFRHDRKRKSAVSKIAEAKLVCAGKIFRKLEENSYKPFDIEGALERLWVIYPQMHNSFRESVLHLDLLPAFFAYIKKEFWSDIYLKNCEELENASWLTPANNRKLKNFFTLIKNETGECHG